MTHADQTFPLAGLKVLDFSRVLAGPFAGRMLSDLGADVIKVEPPEGDMTRQWGKVVAGVSGYFNQQNAGKRSICVDLRAPGAPALMIELARKADILVENYRGDVMGRLGLGYDVLSAANPRLIMLSISGFGKDGPEARRAAYAPIIHAETGLLDRIARQGGFPLVDQPMTVADTNAGLHGLVAVLAAVIMRERTGLGQHIDMAMIDAMLVTDDQAHFDLEASRDGVSLVGEIWHTGAGPILIAADFRLMWRQLMEDFAVADLVSPEMDQSARIAARRAAAVGFFANLPDWTSVVAVLTKLNVAWGQVRTGETLAEQKTLVHRGSIAMIDDRAGGTRPVPQSPYRFSQAASAVRGPGSLRGEHNAEALAEWLGLSEEAIADLHAKGVLAADDGAVAS
jgi:CoA:oxalate CoA-transferase